MARPDMRSPQEKSPEKTVPSGDDREPAPSKRPPANDPAYRVPSAARMVPAQNAGGGVQATLTARARRGITWPIQRARFELALERRAVRLHEHTLAVVRAALRQCHIARREPPARRAPRNARRIHGTHLKQARVHAPARGGRVHTGSAAFSPLKPACARRRLHEVRCARNTARPTFVHVAIVPAPLPAAVHDPGVESSLVLESFYGARAARSLRRRHTVPRVPLEGAHAMLHPADPFPVPASRGCAAKRHKPPHLRVAARAYRLLAMTLPHTSHPATVVLTTTVAQPKHAAPLRHDIE